MTWKTWRVAFTAGVAGAFLLLAVGAFVLAACTSSPPPTTPTASAPAPDPSTTDWICPAAEDVRTWSALDIDRMTTPNKQQCGYYVSGQQTAAVVITRVLPDTLTVGDLRKVREQLSRSITDVPSAGPSAFISVSYAESGKPETCELIKQVVNLVISIGNTTKEGYCDPNVSIRVGEGIR